MAHLLIGDGDEGTIFSEIVLIFNEESISTLKMTWWKELAMYLGIKSDSVTKWQIELNQDKHNYIDVIHKLLAKWRDQEGENATLGAFYAIIPDDKKQLKNFVQAKIRKRAKYWNDLDTDSQDVVLQTNVRFLGRNYSLSKIREMVNEDKFKEILNKFEISDFLQKSFKKEEWDFGHHKIPTRLKYYIDRKIILKTELNSKIFKHECEDIFLIEGIERSQLTNLAGTETETSLDQLDKVTSRFILLEDPIDYITIIKVAESPVHRIMYRKNGDQYFWISTSGSVQIIKSFLKNDGEEIDETIFVKTHLSEFNNRPLAICSSPGMGKSVLLANMAREVTKTYPERILLYFDLSCFVSELSSMELKVDSKNIKQILTSLSMSELNNERMSSIGKEFLLEFLQNDNLFTELFLDGFDNISLEYRQITKQFLKCVMECPNMRMYITSRPHMLDEIENTLEIICLDIVPFNPENQANFLCDYWNLERNIPNREILSQFALKVLESIEFINQSTPSKTELGGIPLQCFMLAQVYTNQAARYITVYTNQAARNTKLPDNIRVLTSFYKLYENFMTDKFAKIGECERQLIKDYHWKEALMLLFPNNKESTQIAHELTKIAEPVEVPWKKIWTVGILEDAQGKPNFVHRTFAEYLLAEFIVTQLLIKEVVDIKISIKFIVDCVLDVYETARGHIVSLDDTFYIREFIESSESWKDKKLNPEKLRDVLLSKCEIPVESIANKLHEILSQWCYQMGSNATIDSLDRSLKVLGCNQLADDLQGKLFQKYPVLQYEMLCTFVNFALEKHEKKLTEKNLRPSKYDVFDIFGRPTYNLDQFRWKFLVCTEHGYQFLTPMLVNFYRDAPIFTKVLNMDDKICKELILRALRNENVKFYEYICETVKPFVEVDFKKFSKMWTLEENVQIKRSPFVETITRGNYKLVEHLKNSHEKNITDMDKFWVACFFDNWKDSSNLISKKVDILKLLIPSPRSNLVEILEKILPVGVNLVLLKTLYELCDYVPSEKDVKYICYSAGFCCRDKNEIDYIVDWLLEKNLAHLLTYRYRSYYCFLTTALLKNTLKPETLSLVYRNSCFDLGIIFPGAAFCKNEAIVKTIVKLADDVDVADKSNNTLLHWAAQGRKCNTINYLLSVNANVNSINEFGNTPLHNILLNTDYPEGFHLVHDIVNLLVTNKAENKAEVNIKNKVGLRAIDIANAHKKLMGIENRTIILLEKSMSDNKGTEPCSDECVKSSTAEFKTIKPGACIDACFSGCFFALIWNYVKTSRNVNLSNSYNTALLHEAALYGKLNTMEFLLSQGADANLKDNNGDTPLHYIFDLKFRPKINFVKVFPAIIQTINPCVNLLLKYNAKVSVKNNNGETALDWAQHLKDTLEIQDHTIQLLNEKLQEECLLENTNFVDLSLDEKTSILGIMDYLLETTERSCN